MLISAGTDVSKDYFDICVLGGKVLQCRFPNTPPGLRKCEKWLESHSIGRLQLVMEPTGRYGELIAEYMHAKKHRVLLAQPLKSRRFAESLDMRIKSDCKDAYALAVYAKEPGESLRDWRPRTDLEWELRDMSLLIRSLTKRTTSLQCQLKCMLRSQYVEEHLRNELERCEEELKEVLRRAKGLVLQHPNLSKESVSRRQRCS